MNTTHIQKIFDQNKGIVPAQHLLEKGISYYDINKLLEKEVLIKLKRGLYKWANSDTDELAEVACIIPKGVFCLHTACLFYELTTFVPSEYHIAIPDEHRVVLPDYPPVKVYYWNPIPYQLGITTVELDNDVVKMYDLEKTICDIIRHRQKIGFDVLKEVLKNYLKRKDRNLHQLSLYAKQLNIFNKVDEFIKILL